MRFDDRLQTVIDAPVADARDRAVRWRQLVDLLSRMERIDAGGAAGRALDIVRSEAGAIDQEVRAATVRSIAGRQVAGPLLAVLAEQPIAVAAPLFAGLRLSAADAGTILATADPDVRAMVAVEPEAEPSPVEPAKAPDPPRAMEIPVSSAPTEPLVRPREASGSGSGRLFEWESDPTGHIAWVEGAPRGALVGRPLAGDTLALLERNAGARLAQRHPFVDVPLALAGALEGEWSATAVPAFDPATGRFLGYRGLARRVDGSPAPAPSEPRERDADSLREMVHEIKTPLNAIIGFAEIIDGQYLGPAHVRYRDRAAQIVLQARKLLEAVEDLDLAATLRAERNRGGTGSRLADIFPPIAGELERCVQTAGGDLQVDIEDERLRCALSPALSPRLARRLLLALCDQVTEGEAFRVSVTSGGGMALLTVARPRALYGIGEQQMVDPAFDPRPGQDGATVGLGFALRLVRGLARVAGGDLRIDEHRVTLALPALEH